MRKIKYIAGLLMAISLVWSANSVYAAQQGNVYDDAGLLTETELVEIDTKVTSIMEETGWNIYAVTTADSQGKSATAYADDFFDEHSPEQEDGVAVLIDMDNREIVITASGIAMRYLTDDRRNEIMDDAYFDVSDEAYSDCLMTMLEGAEYAYDMGIPDGQYNYDVETGEVSVYRTITLFEGLIAAGIAVGAGVLTYVIIVGKYRLKFDSYDYDFRENSNLELREKTDRFVNETTTRRRIPKQTGSSGGGGHNSSGRSSTHRSSSGRSHSSSSRKF